MSKRVLFRRSTNKPIEDFQIDGTAVVLRDNAIRAGYNSADIEVRVVSDSTWQQHETDTYAEQRAAREIAARDEKIR